MTDLQSEVLHQLSHTPIKNKLLAQRLGFKNDRAIRQAIHDLILAGQPIIFTQHGIKIAEDIQEIDHNLESLKSYLKNIGRRYKYLKLARVKFTGQTKMRFQ